MVNFKKQYENYGYYLAKSVFNDKFCNKLKNYLNELEPKVKIPFSDIPYGYGNLLNEGPFEEVTNNDLIKKYVMS